MTTIRTLTIILVLFCGNLSLAQDQQVIDVNERRPVLAALDRMEALATIPINYEDIPFEHDDDLELVNDPRIQTYIQGRRSRVPRNVSVTAKLGELKTDSGRLLAIDSILNAYRRNGRSGDFSVELANGMLYVTANSVRARDGSQKAVKSPMLTKVSIPFETRTLADTLTLIAQQISKDIQIDFLLGTVPPQYGITKVSFGSNGLTARDAVAKLLSEYPPMSYRLIFDTLINGYLINFQPVDLGANSSPTETRSDTALSGRTPQKWHDVAMPPSQP